jgi:hypothetical protein
MPHPGRGPAADDVVISTPLMVHMCLRSSDMAKMDLNAADMALAVWDGYVQDARRLAGQ